MKEIIRIMFVCHGNICRSPMAEFVLKDMVKRRGVADSFYIQSAATSTEEIWGDVGNPVYPPAKAELLKHGITCEGKRAVQLKRSDYDKYDFIIGMDTQNIKNLMRILGSDPEGKVRKLKDYTVGGDVADPWYSGNFEVTYRDIYDGCEAILSDLGY